MLRITRFDQIAVLAFSDLGQAGFTIIIIGIIPAFGVEFDKAIKEHDLTCRAQRCAAILGEQVDRCALKTRIFHL